MNTTTIVDKFKNDKVIRDIKKTINDQIKLLRTQLKQTVDQLTKEKVVAIEKMKTTEDPTSHYHLEKSIKKESYDKVKTIKKETLDKINQLKLDMEVEIEKYKKNKEEEWERLRVENERLAKERQLAQREIVGTDEWSPSYFVGTDYNRTGYSPSYSPSYNSKSCYTGEGKVKMWNNEMKVVKDLEVGDVVYSDGKPARIEARTFSVHNDLHSIVRIGTLCITTRHPVSWKNGKWRRPIELGQCEMVFVEKLYNFVVEGRGSVIIDGVQVSTLGQFVPGIDNENSYYGSERCVDELKKHYQWPDMDLTNEKEKTEPLQESTLKVQQIECY